VRVKKEPCLNPARGPTEKKTLTAQPKARSCTRQEWIWIYSLLTNIGQTFFRTGDMIICHIVFDYFPHFSSAIRWFAIFLFTNFLLFLLQKIIVTRLFDVVHWKSVWFICLFS
jgi:hypothetical protein